MSRNDSWDDLSAINNNQRQDVKMDTPELDKILERTKKSVRAVLNASKDLLDLSSLEKEYYEMYEENIPWRKLDFTSLGEFLRAIPSVASRALFLRGDRAALSRVCGCLRRQMWPRCTRIREPRDSQQVS